MSVEGRLPDPVNEALRRCADATLPDEVLGEIRKLVETVKDYLLDAERNRDYDVVHSLASAVEQAYLTAAERVPPAAAESLAVGSTFWAMKADYAAIEGAVEPPAALGPRQDLRAVPSGRVSSREQVEARVGRQASGWVVDRASDVEDVGATRLERSGLQLQRGGSDPLTNLNVAGAESGTSAQKVVRRNPFRKGPEPGREAPRGF